MKEIIIKLFIRFKKLFIWFKHNTGDNLRTNLFNFITLNKDIFRITKKKIKKFI